MKRFIIFSYPEYYPSGGSGDIKSIHETEDEAIEEFARLLEDGKLSEFAYIFDIEDPSRQFDLDKL